MSSKPFKILYIDVFSEGVTSKTGVDISNSSQTLTLRLNDKMDRWLDYKFITKPENLPHVEDEHSTSIHGAKAIGAFFQGFSGKGVKDPMKIHVVLAQAPKTLKSFMKDTREGYYKGKKRRLKENFDRMSYNEILRDFNIARFYDDKIRREKPDIILSSVHYGDPVMSDITKRGFVTLYDALEVVARETNTPIINSIPNSRSSTKIYGGFTPDEDSPFVLVGSHRNTGRIAKHAGTVISFLNNPDSKVLVRKKLDVVDDVSVGKGNSFVAPLFAGIATSIALKTNKRQSDHYGFDMSVKLFLVDYLKRVKEGKGVKSLSDTLESFDVLQSLIATGYNQTAKKRGVLGGKKFLIPDSDFVDNTLNLDILRPSNR